MNPVRVKFWLLLVPISVLLVFCGLIVAKALGPERGAAIYLMGLPLPATPLALLIAVELGLVYFRGEHLRTWERALGYTLGALLLVPCAMLLILG